MSLSKLEDSDGQGSLACYSPWDHIIMLLSLIILLWNYSKVIVVNYMILSENPDHIVNTLIKKKYVNEIQLLLKMKT